MDEYEVDLRDYLRVLWRGKWIVFLTVVVALGVAAFVSFRSPNIFQAEVVLKVQVPLRRPATYLAPSIAEVNERVQDRALLLSALGDEEAVSWLVDHWNIKKEGDFLGITVDGARSVAELVELLRPVVEAVRKEYQRGVEEVIAVRLDEVTRQAKTIDRQLQLWRDMVDQTVKKTEIQEGEILTAIDVIRKNRDLMLLEVGEQSRRLEGSLAERELALLYRRLEPVQLLLDGVAREGVRYFGQFAGRTVEAEAELVELSEEADDLQSLLNNPPTPITIVRGPQGLEEPIGPRRAMNLAVAGVLGLFVGVLLAFFWHWLSSPKQVPPGAKAPAPKGNAPNRDTTVE